MANAESLFLCTLANTIWPGAKIIHSVCGSILNMKTANLSMGAAETCLLSSGELALAQFYGLPTYRMGGYSDSYYPDVQAGIEKMAATLILAQSNADLIVMGGPLNCAAHQSYEQVVIDHDIWEMSERIATEIAVNEETLAYDTVAKVGPGGSYIGEDHTLRWVRSGEHYYGGSFNHTGLPGEDNTMLASAHRAGGGDPGAPVRVPRAARHGPAHQGLRSRSRSREERLAAGVDGVGRRPRRRVLST